MPIMRSAVLCGPHSGDLVPDLHGSVSESGDIETLATHVSHHDFMCVCMFCLIKIPQLLKIVLALGQMFKYSVYSNFNHIQMHFCPFEVLLLLVLYL